MFPAGLRRGNVTLHTCAALPTPSRSSRQGHSRVALQPNPLGTVSGGPGGGGISAPRWSRRDCWRGRADRAPRRPPRALGPGGFPCTPHCAPLRSRGLGVRGLGLSVGGGASSSLSGTALQLEWGVPDHWSYWIARRLRPGSPATALTARLPGRTEPRPWGILSQDRAARPPRGSQPGQREHQAKDRPGARPEGCRWGRRPGRRASRGSPAEVWVAAPVREPQALGL